MRKLLFTGLLCLITTFGFQLRAQKEGAVWYFGNYAGLDFNLHYPRPLTDGQTNTREGVATICDKDGNLLFYTDGQTVYNRRHQIMSNGEGLFGDISSTQSSIIVPKPNDPSRYYIFTVDKVGEGGVQGKGLNYSIVDLLINAPLGRVTEKNVPLLANSTEKITAIKHADKESYWIVAHGWNNNQFHEFLLTRSEIRPVAVIPVGSEHRNTDPNDRYNRGATGYLKSSPKGDYLAVAVESLHSFELFSFDNSTGNIRLLANLPAGDRSDPYAASHPAYGVEFSPTSNYLYGSTRQGGFIYQWDITKTDPEAIKRSVKILRENSTILCGALQLAFNGKIYVCLSGQQYLGVINSPIQDNCNYVEQGASLLDNQTGKGGKAYFGLPTFLPDFFRAAEFYYENTCFQDTTIFYLSTRFGIAGAPKWDIYDENGNIYYGSASVDKDTWIGTFAFPASGNYLVNMTVEQGGTVVHRREVTIHSLPEVNFPDTTSLCKGSSVLLDAGYGAFYSWRDNQNLTLERYRTINQPGNFMVTVKHYNGCVNTDSTRIVEMPPPAIRDTVITKAACGYATGSITLVMEKPPSEYDFIWKDFPDNKSNTVQNLRGGVYEVEISSKVTTCSITSKFTVSEENAPEVTIRSSVSTAVCPGTSVTLTAGGAPNFLWQDPVGLTTPEITVSPLKTTTYIVKGYSPSGQGECSAYAEITIEVNPIQKPELGLPRSACEGDTVTLDGGENNKAWRWNTGDQTRFVDISSSVDLLILEVTDNNGCIWSDTTHVTINPLPTVDLGRDRIVCQGTPVILDAGPADKYIWNTGDSVQFVDVKETGIYAVTIIRLGCTGSDDVFIRVNSRDSLRIDSVNIRDISCNGANDGSLQIYVNGEGSYYEYSIDGGTTFRDNQGYFDNLGPGSDYEIVITEDSVCTLRDTADIQIYEPDVITMEYSQIPPTCSECTDGEIRLSVSGGTPPYLIQWVTLDTTATLKNIGLGSYPVAVTDVNGCRSETMIELLKGEEEIPLEIPNAFTPNGDGINEKWVITFLKDKPDCVVQVFNRTGRMVFESERGYPEPWDGRGPDGNILPVGSYFYLLRLNDTLKPMTGTVTIIK